MTALQRGSTQCGARRGRVTTAARAVAAAQLLKAIAHPRRVRVLGELAYGERCVSDVRAALGSSLASVSRDLAHLHAAGVVRTRKRGTYVFYRWSSPCVGRLLRCVGSLLRQRARQAAYAHAQRVTPRGNK